MHVVEEDDKGAISRDRLQQRRRGVEQAHARSLGLGRKRLGQVRKSLEELGKELSEVGDSGSELRAEKLGIELSEIRTQSLHPRPVGRSSAGLPAAADEHPGSALARAP